MIHEQYAEVSPGIDLCYETFGDPADPAILLVMGLGTQMIAWPAPFIDQLVDAGFFVVRFDNRDCGHSTRMTGKPPGLLDLALRRRSAATYSLSDMASDAVGLLDVLDVGAAHVVGASMGGMIAQRMAIEHPGRVLSLTSIMSNPGSRFTGQPRPNVYPTFLRPAPRERAAYVAHILALYRVIGAQGLAQNPTQLEATAELAFDRGVSVSGTGRQLAAILTDPDRRPGLAELEIPAVVVHGTDDSLIAPSGGRATARAIPGAELVVVEGMGHDLPAGAWPTITGAIVRVAERAQNSWMTSRMMTTSMSPAPPTATGRCRAQKPGSALSREWRPSGGIPTQSSSSSS